jgi:hypothetical protein
VFQDVEVGVEEENLPHQGASPLVRCWLYVANITSSRPSSWHENQSDLFPVSRVLKMGCHG